MVSLNHQIAIQTPIASVVLPAEENVTRFPSSSMKWDGRKAKQQTNSSGPKKKPIQRMAFVPDVFFSAKVCRSLLIEERQVFTVARSHYIFRSKATKKACPEILDGGEERANVCSNLFSFPAPCKRCLRCKYICEVDFQKVVQFVRTLLTVQNESHILPPHDTEVVELF